METEFSPNSTFSTVNKQLKKLITLVILLAVFLGCMIVLLFKSVNTGGDRILIVNIASEDEKKDLSEVEYVKKAIEAGGHITVNVDIARKVEGNKFDLLYTVADKNNKFVILPAILNWVGGHGWKLNQGSPLPGIWVFTKPRGIF
jgi:hypothetical protein